MGCSSSQTLEKNKTDVHKEGSATEKKKNKHANELYEYNNLLEKFGKSELLQEALDIGTEPQQAWEEYIKQSEKADFDQAAFIKAYSIKIIENSNLKIIYPKVEYQAYLFENAFSLFNDDVKEFAEQYIQASPLFPIKLEGYYLDVSQYSYIGDYLWEYFKFNKYEFLSIYLDAAEANKIENYTKIVEVLDYSDDLKIFVLWIDPDYTDDQYDLSHILPVLKALKNCPNLTHIAIGTGMNIPLALNEEAQKAFIDLISKKELELFAANRFCLTPDNWNSTIDTIVTSTSLKFFCYDLTEYESGDLQKLINKLKSKPSKNLSACFFAGIPGNDIENLQKECLALSPTFVGIGEHFNIINPYAD